ncbi:MAG TPA: TolC family protein [Blastocatellia bacterium]|nr:TolC family protein [Blastocatellia bacterium]
MRVPYRSLSFLLRAVSLPLVLSLALPAGAAAQIVKLAQTPAQESKQRDSSAAQTPAAPRVGVDESRPLALPLFDAVKMALEQNREIEVERINVRQAEYDLFAARGATDISLGASSFYEHKNVPVGSVLAGGPDGSLTTKSLNYDFTAQQLLPTGAQWLAGFTNSRADSNSVFASLNPQYTTALNIQIRQPVLRNFSIDDARRRIRIASRALDLSDSQFRQKAIDIIARVQRSYWDLVFALRDVQIQRASVELARTQLERNKRMVNEGTLAPIELVSVETELEKRRENVLTAIENVTRAENALKQLVLGDRESGVWNQPIIPTDAPDLRAVSFALADAVASAFANRPELAQNNLKQEVNKIDVKYFASQTKPQVDLIASYTSTGLSGSPLLIGNPFTATTTLLVDRVNALSNLAGIPPVAIPPSSPLPGFLLGGYGQSLSNLFSNDFRTFRFGVAFSFPVRNRAAEGQLGRAFAEGRKIGAQRKTLEQTIEVEVRNAVQAVETGRLRVETARASREAAEKQSESEQRRFQAGLSTTYFVLERQNDLSAAQGRELKAMTDYSKAVTELQRVMGTTLTTANVEVNSAPKK